MKKCKYYPKLTHVGACVDLVVPFSLSVSALHTVVSKWSEIEKNYLRCGPLLIKERKYLKTSPLEELETILSAWFKQAHTTKASINGPHLKEKALHIAAHLGIDSFQASSGWIYRFKKRHNLVYTTLLEGSAIGNSETVMDWKSEERPPNDRQTPAEGHN